MVRAMTRWPLIVVVVVACGPGGKPPGTTTTTGITGDKVAVTPRPEPDLTPPKLRLPDGVRPTHNAVELTIDPDSEDFSGVITSELDVARATDVIWLDAFEITVDKAVITAGSDTITATAKPIGKEFLAIIPDRTLPAGTATMRIEYRGKAHKDDGTGIYRAQEDNRWYALTQFENTDAREAFPTFDEPSFKIPWQLTIHCKKELLASSNTPIEAETDEANGMKAVKFAETPPMPSYLVAFVVGPFDAVDAGTSRGGAPIRVLVPKGRSADAAYAAEATKPILDLLEDYFGTPYPFAKLDLAAHPVFNAGAMENPGLITWREAILLVKPEDMTLGRKQNFAIDVAHEMAHMWFGDYVTMAWWDDVWLNESFATWMEAKIIDQWKPEWDVPVELVQYKSGVMGSDSLDAARAIRQPIETDDDIANAFDGITYEKGNAVLTMIERWVGPDKWQAGVRDYLAKHAWGNATFDDFVSAMSAASGQDLKPMFDSFVKQSGVPLVTVDMTCDKGAPPTLKLAQRRYAPTGSQIDPNRLWAVPVCVRWGAGKTTGRDCTLLTEATGTLELSAKSCPSWVLPNEAELGYYRAAPSKSMLDGLLKNSKQLTVAERVGLFGDVGALSGAGLVDTSVELSLVDTVAKENNRFLVDASIGIVAGIDEMVPDNLRANYERLIKKRFRARAIELGWKSKAGEDDNVKELRPAVLSLVGVQGKDKELIKQATELTWKWLDDHSAIQPELVGVALGIAARNGDQKLYDRFYADAKKATEREERERLLGAMGAFLDPKIVTQVMALVLTDEFDMREAGGLMQAGFADHKTRETAYQFVKDHFDDIANKLPAPYRAYMAFTVVALCDDKRTDEVNEFFTPRVAKFEGGPRVMKQAIEQMHLCAATKKAQTPGVVAFLKKQ